MLDQFQTAVASVYNGWVLFGCLIFAAGIFPSLSMKLTDMRKFRLVRFACLLGLIASAYVFLVGVHQAIDWVNPFAGKEADVAKTVHNVKGGIIVLLIVVWPYFLMLVGGLIGHLCIRDLRRYWTYTV